MEARLEAAPVTLNQLRTFLAVAETGSVRAAASELVVTQAAVSASLAEAFRKEVGPKRRAWVMTADNEMLKTQFFLNIVSVPPGGELVYADIIGAIDASGRFAVMPATRYGTAELTVTSSRCLGDFAR